MMLAKEDGVFVLLHLQNASEIKCNVKGLPDRAAQEVLPPASYGPFEALQPQQSALDRESSEPYSVLLL